MVNKKIFALIFKHSYYGLVFTLTASDFGEHINNECFPLLNHVILLRVASPLYYRFSLKGDLHENWNMVKKKSKTPVYFYISRRYALEIYNGSQIAQCSNVNCIAYDRPYNIPSLMVRACKQLMPNSDIRQTRNEILTKLNVPHFKELCQIVESSHTYHELRLSLLHEDLFQKSQDRI